MAHSEHTQAEPGHLAHGHGHPTVELKFDPQDVAMLQGEEREAGMNLGKLLAAIFCILLVLMTGVTWWTSKYYEKNVDPQAFIEADTHSSH